MNKVLDKEYVGFIAEIKQSIIRSRYQAARLANREQLVLYLFVGKRLAEKIQAKKWGAKVLQQIANDLQHELPGLRGFSERSLINMRQFANEYATALITQLVTAQTGKRITQSVTAQLENVFRQSATAQIKKEGKHIEFTENYLKSFFSISFTHHIMLLTKCKNIAERAFYMQMAAGDMWSVSALEHHIVSKLYKHQGKLPNNFKTTLPNNMRSAALNVFKDEYAGKLNFYLNVLDDKVKLQHEKPSIGIILCKEKNNTEVEYSFRNINKAIGAATYKLSAEVPKEMKGILPDVKKLKKVL